MFVKTTTRTDTRTIRISPLSPAGLILGIIFQTYLGWHVPVDFIDLLKMMFIIFIFPTMIFAGSIIFVVALFTIVPGIILLCLAGVLRVIEWTVNLFKNR